MAPTKKVELVDALDLDVLASLGGVDHLSVAYVHPDVVDVSRRPEEDEVTGHQAGDADSSSEVVLVLC